MIHALPGMGADHRMYPEPWRQLPDFRAHDWTSHAGETTLPEVARSMDAACGIQDGDVLVGSSLGGMIACEISKFRRIAALYLIGSAVRSAEINGLLAKLRPLAKVAPIDWLRLSAGKIPHELAQMFSSMESSFIRAMCQAVFAWEGLGSTPVPVYRLHGRFDLVIPPPEHADLLLEGGHLIAISHARACVEFVRQQEERRLRPPPTTG